MIKKKYIDLFEKNREETYNKSFPIMNNMRDDALNQFKSLGIPTSELEDYKNSDLSKLFEYNLDITNESNSYSIYSGPTIINGLLKEESIINMQEGCYIGSMSDFANKNPKIFENHYAKIAKSSDNGIVAYNTMFAENGIVIHIKANIKQENPIVFSNIIKGNNINVNTRILIIAEKNSMLKLIFNDRSSGNGNILVTQVTEVYAEENAEIHIYKIENNTENVKQITYLSSIQETQTNINISGITINNGFTRNNYMLKLAGEHSNANVSGLSICDKSQHIDNLAYLHHAVPNCTSNELFKNILDDKATGSFCGKIRVEVDAQKTQAYQTNRNLCKSKEAHIYSKPQLEIYADDVKCSHGLTIGQLDSEALFYMRARGIDKKEAEILLTESFAQEVIDFINLDQSFKDDLRVLVEKRLREK